MKKLLLTLIVAAFCSVGFAQMSGSYSVPGDYATLAAAITDLNTVGVSGAVTITLTAGNPETAPAGGYVIGGTGSALLTSTSASNTVTIIGGGNTITASGSLTAGALNDAIFKIIGADYITLQDFVMQENAANTTTAAATNNMTEWGVALLYVTTTDGAKNITIKNNTISLVRTYQNTFGIYSNVRHSPTAIATAADITNVSGANDNTTILGNNISNVNNGIVIVGSTTAAYMNTGINIGGSSASTANTISNYGVTGTFSGYISVSGSVMGINVNNSLNVNISYNSVTCPGLNTAGTVYGIYYQATGTLPTTGGPYSHTLSYNTLAIKTGLSSGAVYGLYNTVGNSIMSYDVSYNDFNNMGHNVASPTGAVYALYSSGGANTQTINYNTFSNLSLTTTGSVYLLHYGNSLPLATSTQTVTNNAIVGTFSKSGAGGTVYCAYSNSSSVAGSTKNISYNDFSNITVTGSTVLIGFTDTDGGTPVKAIHHNTFSNVTGGTSGITGLTFNYGTADIYSNSFFNIASSGAITVMSCGGSSATAQNVYSNTIYGIASSGASAIYGIQSLASGTSAVSKVYGNKIYDMAGSNASSIVYGIYVTAGTTIHTYNNFISDLRTPSANAAIPLAGIYISGGTTNNVFYNTVYLNASSGGALFGSAAVYASTTPTLDMRNNVLVNVSTPNGATGFTAAYRRSGTTLTSYSNNSNANCLYAGTPGANNLIFYDGTNSKQTIADFKTWVGPTRDALSFTENPPFLNVASTPYNLHMNTGIATYCESGALSIASPIAITTDFDGDTRTSTPDVGADEFAGIAAGVINPGAFTATVISSQQINLSFNLNASNNDVAVVWNATGTFTAPSGTPPAIGDPFAGGTLLYYGNASPVQHTGLTPGTAYYYKAYSFDGANYSEGVSATGTPSVAPPTAFTATAVSSTQINLAYTLNAQSNNVIIATNSTATFGTPVNGTAYAVTDAITGGGTVIYVGPLNAFSHTGLTTNTAYYYKVWSVDAFDYYSGTGATANATTLLVAPTPYTEGFATTTTPTGWNTTGWTIGSTTAIGGNPLYSIYKNLWSSATTATFTTVNVGPVTADMKLTFDYKLADYASPYAPPAAGSGNFVVSVSTDWGATFTPLETVSNNALAGWQSKEYSLASYAGSQLQIKIVGNWVSGDYYLAFDNIKVQVPPSCIAPTLLNITNLQATSASVNWTASTSNPASGYDIYYSTSSTAPIESTTPSGSVAAGVVTYSMTPLAPATLYYAWVRSNCGAGLYSEWAGPVSFTTLCNPISSLPWTEGFEGVTIPAFPSCWSKENGDWITTNNANSTYDADARTGTQFLREAWSATNEFMWSPGFALTSGKTYQFSFWWAGDTYAGWTGEVFYNSAQNSTGATQLGTSFVTSGTTTTKTYAEAKYSFSPATTGTYYFAIRVNATSVPWYLSFDDFKMEEIETGSIDGTITDCYSNGALEGVTVSLGGGITTTTDASGYYLLNNLPVGTYTITATKAGYNNKVVSGVAVTVNNTTTENFCMDIYLAPPYNLQASVLGLVNVQLTWNAAGSALPDQWLQWDNGTFSSSIGTNAAANFDVASRWPVADIATYGGMYLTKVKFVPAVASASCTYTIKIWKGTNAATLVHSQVVSSITVNAWNTVTLSTPVLIDGSQELWFGYNVNTTTGYPAGCDAGPQIAGKGNMIYWAGAWQELTNLNAVLTYNWNIAGFITASSSKGPQGEIELIAGEQLAAPGFAKGTTNTGSLERDPNFWNEPPAGATSLGPQNSSNRAPSATLLGYNVYRDNVVISPSNYNSLFFIDPNLPYATYVYKVSAQYLEGESGFAGPVTVTLVPCVAPSNGIATGITTSAADLDWDDNTGASAWDIELVTFGTTPTGTPTYGNVGVHPYTVTGLSAATKYSFYVRARCSDEDFSSWAGPYTFTTLCDTYTPPFSQNFDSYTVGSIPTCWAISPVVASQWRIATGQANSAPNAMVTYYNSTIAKDDWFFTPAINLVAGKSYDIKFYVKAPGWDGVPEKLEVKWGTTPTIAGMTGGTIFYDANMLISTYTQKTGNFIPATSGVYYFGWHAFSDADVDYIAVDDIVIMETPTCFEPTAITLNAVATTTATLGWTQTGTPLSWDIEYGVSPYTFTGVPTLTGITNPYQLINLLPSTTYQVKVRAKCGEGEYSIWSSTYSFTTLCDAFALPLNETFETTSTSLGCWTAWDVDGLTPSWTTSTTYNHTTGGSRSAYHTYNASGAGNENDYLVTPALIIPATGTSSLSFWSYNSFPTYYYKNSVLISMGSPNPANGDYVEVWSPSSVTAAWVNTVLDLTEYAGHTIYIAFRYEGEDAHAWYLDDVSVTNTPPAIPTVTTDAITNITTTTADGGGNVIADGGAAVTARGVCWNTTGSPTIANAYTVNGSGTGAFASALTSLAPGTTYYVRAYATNSVGTAYGNEVSFATQAGTKTLNVKALLEGLYAGNGTMFKAQGYDDDYNLVDQFPGTTADQVKIELRDETDGTLVYTLNNVNVSTTGQISESVPAAYSGNYYLYIYHRNSVTTSTFEPVSFAGSTITFDFTDDYSKAYGDNMKDLGDGYFALYCGDVDQDGGVGTLDMGFVDNEAANFGGGYIPEDVDGDGGIGTIDMGLIDNNSANFVSAILPFGGKRPHLVR